MKKKKLPTRVLKYPQDMKAIGKHYTEQRKKRAKIFIRAKYTGNNKVAEKMRKSVWDETMKQRQLGNGVGNWRKAMVSASKTTRRKK